MKAYLYDRNNIIATVDCNDIDHIDNPCYEGDNVIEIHMRDHSTKLCDDFVFELEEPTKPAEPMNRGEALIAAILLKFGAEFDTETPEEVALIKEQERKLNRILKIFGI